MPEMRVEQIPAFIHLPLVSLARMQAESDALDFHRRMRDPALQAALDRVRYLDETAVLGGS